MRRMLVAVLILGIIITLWALEDKAVDNMCTGMLENIERLRAADKEELDYAIEKTQREWERYEKILEMCTPHEDTDEINVNWAVYKGKIAEGNHAAAGYSLDEMSQRLREMRGKMKVSIQNIF